MALNGNAEFGILRESFNINIWIIPDDNTGLNPGLDEKGFMFCSKKVGVLENVGSCRKKKYCYANGNLLAQCLTSAHRR